MKFFISLFTTVLLSQTLYQGSLNFSYNGSETGSFSSSIEDTTSFGGALNITLNDSSKLSATMAAGTKFTTKVNNEDYEFVTIASHQASSTGLEIPFSNIEVHEEIQVPSSTVQVSQ